MYIHVCICACVCAWMYAHVLVCVHVCVCVRACVRVRILKESNTEPNFHHLVFVRVQLQLQIVEGHVM